MIDTHSHIYAEEFDDDFDDVVLRACNAGVDKIVLANVDLDSLRKIIKVWENNKTLFIPTIGLHPTEVKEDFKEVLDEMSSYFEKYPFKALGETGIDLYWDKTFLDKQIESFQWHIDMSVEKELPLIIHVRDSFEQVKEVLNSNKNMPVKGIIHSFTGNAKDAEDIMSCGDFIFGINGIVTFKNSNLGDVVKEIGLERIVLETDAPYLSPVPYRGKRNEPSYMLSTKNKIAEIFNISTSEVDEATNINAKRIFKL